MASPSVRLGRSPARGSLLLCAEPAYDPHPISDEDVVGGMVDVGLNHRAVDAELAPAGEFQRTSQLNATLLKRCDGLGADRIGPADEGGVVGRSLQIEPPELPQDYGIVHESLGLRVASSIKPLEY